MGSATRGRGGGVGGVRVDDASDVLAVAVDVGVGGRVRGRGEGGGGAVLDLLAVEGAHDHVVGAQLVVGDAGGLDDEQVGLLRAVAAVDDDALGDVAGGPHDEVPADELAVEGGDALAGVLDSGLQGLVELGEDDLLTRVMTPS